MTSTDAGNAASDAGPSDSGVDGGGDPGECPEVPLDATGRRVLVLAPASAAPAHIAATLQGMLAGSEVVGRALDVPGMTHASLAGFWYAPVDRSARISALTAGFGRVVMLDDADVALAAPELHFEGVRQVACAARRAGAVPLLVQSVAGPAPALERLGELAYRVGNGTGTAVAPAGYAWSTAGLDGGAAERAVLVAASIHAALTGRLAPTDGGLAALARAALDAELHHATVSHYSEPFRSAVQLKVADAGTLRFMSSGTSSEQLWYERMLDILPRLGITGAGVAIGACNPWKAVDEVCRDRAVAAFAGQRCDILFARDYSVSAQSISSAGQQSDLQVQVWDRHWDALSEDGAEAILMLDERSMWASSLARSLGLAWLPHHLTFAKLKLERPSVQLTTDGTHASSPVSYALATMSVVSRTSREVPTAGLDADTAAAVRLASQTVRQLATLSRRGAFVPDEPRSRPRARLP